MLLDREQITLDKYEYKVRSDEIKALIDRREYAQAAEIADTIDWRRVKSVMMLCTIGDVYKKNRRYRDAKNMLLLAYDRMPGGRSICYSLCEICIKTEEFVEAVNYYKEFVQAAPKDSGRYILQYKLYEAQDVSLEERIGVLEELKKRDYREKWAYELAYLYHRVGLATRCVEECDELILWFGDGKYVVKAMELKMLHEPLTPAQQRKYDHRFDREEESAEEQTGETYDSLQAEGQEEAYGQHQEETYGPSQRENQWDAYGQSQEGQWDGYNQSKGEGQWDAYGQSQEDQWNGYNQPKGEGKWNAYGQSQEAQWDGYNQSKGEGQWNAYGQSQEDQWDGYNQPKGEGQWDAYGPSQGGGQWDAYGPSQGGSSEEGQNPTGMEPESTGSTDEEALNIQVKTVDVGRFNTINLQAELAAGLQEVLGTEAEKMEGTEVFFGETGEVSKAQPMSEKTENSPAHLSSGADGESSEKKIPGASEPLSEKGMAETAGNFLERNLASPEEPAEGFTTSEEFAADEESAMAAGVAMGAGQDTAELVLAQMRMELARKEKEQKLPANESPEAFLQEENGQIRIVMPEHAVVEKQITGQMKIEDILAEWEKTKKDNEEKYKEEIRQDILRQTGPMFTEFEASIRDGLLERLEKAEGIDEREERRVRKPVNSGSTEAEENLMKTEETETDTAVPMMQTDGFRKEESRKQSDTISKKRPLEQPVVPAGSMEEPIQESPVSPAENREESIQESPISPLEGMEGGFQESSVVSAESMEESIQESSVVSAESMEESIQEPPVSPAEGMEGGFQESPVSSAEGMEGGFQESPISPAESMEESIQESPISPVEGMEGTFAEHLEESAESMGAILQEPPAEGMEIDFPEQSESLVQSEGAAETDSPLPRNVRKDKGYTEETGGYRSTKSTEEPAMERDVLKVRGLTREEKELYAPFIQSRSAREKLVQAIDNISMAAYTGNVVVTGEEGMDTMTFVKNMIREVQMMDRNFSGKVAKVSGQGLNQRNVEDTLWHLNNGALIIYKASGMEPRTASALHKSLQQENLGIIVVLEDTKKAIQRLFLGTPDLFGDFTARMDLEALSNDTLVSFGRRYAREREYAIDELGVLALHTRIEELQTIDHVVTVVEVKKIVDQAIRHACKKTLGHFFDILLSKRYDEEDMIILTEKDFA